MNPRCRKPSAIAFSPAVELPSCGAHRWRFDWRVCAALMASIPAADAEDGPTYCPALASHHRARRHQGAVCEPHRAAARAQFPGDGASPARREIVRATERELIPATRVLSRRPVRPSAPLHRRLITQGLPARQLGGGPSPGVAELCGSSRRPAGCLDKHQHRPDEEQRTIVRLIPFLRSSK